MVKSNSNSPRQRIKGGIVIPDDVDFPDGLLGKISGDDDFSIATPDTYTSPKQIHTPSSSDEAGIFDSSSASTDDDNDSDLDADALLAYATLRLQQQHLKDEIKALNVILNEKDGHILELSDQLKRATASKCDLVVHVTELEREKQKAEQYGSVDAQEHRQKCLRAVEKRAEIEIGFINELNTLTCRLNELDRRHKNHILEKDFIIAQLNEQLRHYLNKYY